MNNSFAVVRLKEESSVSIFEFPAMQPRSCAYPRGFTQIGGRLAAQRDSVERVPSKLLKKTDSETISSNRHASRGNRAEVICENIHTHLT
jgi:hypothetical protein